MTRQCLLIAATLAILAGPPVLAQTKGDVIVPPPVKSDGSVIQPPAKHADPGIEKGKPPEQSQLPDEKDKPSSDAPPPKTEKER